MNTRNPGLTDPPVKRLGCICDRKSKEDLEGKDKDSSTSEICVVGVEMFLAQSVLIFIDGPKSNDGTHECQRQEQSVNCP